MNSNVSNGVIILLLYISGLSKLSVLTVYSPFMAT